MGQTNHIDPDSALLTAEHQAQISRLQGKDTEDNVQNVKKYKCTYQGCHNEFTRSSRLVRHMRLHNGERPFKCNHLGCDKAYTNSSHLKRHMQSHNTLKKTFQCTQCSLMISNLHNLKRHYERVHNEKNKLHCNHCSVTFTKKHQLAQHMSIHVKNIYSCEKCNKSFTDSNHFKKHKRTHVEAKKYPCTVSHCSEVFHKWNDLCAHKRSQHSPEQKCMDCGKTFLTKYRLKFHAQIHKDNRPVVVCPYEKCHRQYFFNRNLDQHIRVKHQGEKFYCDICSAGLSSKQKLIDHISIRHDPNRIKKKVKKLKQRKKRKDAGTIKKSVISTLVGIAYQPDLDKVLLQRTPKVELTEERDEINKTMCEQDSDV